MCLEDINDALRRIDALHKLPAAQRGGRKGFLKSENARLARLAGLGLIHETIEMRASHPIKPEDGYDGTLFCAAASVVSAPQSRITGSNEMNSVFVITFLSKPFWGES
jgi:hypothetical protein